MMTSTELGFRPSPQQRRVWRLQKEGATCSLLCALSIEGDLDRGALRQALAETVERHEILRTALRLPAGLTLPLQVILEPGPATLPEVDLQGLAPGLLQAVTTALLHSLGGRPFDLGRGEGLRAILVRLGPDRREMLLTLSAACADAGAVEPLAADLFAAYARRRAGGGRPPEPPLQYADVAEWQNNLLESEDTAEGGETWQERWREQDLDARITLPLPLEDDEAAPGPFVPRYLAVPLASGTAGALARLATSWDCPPEVLLLTAWMAVMQRGTGRDETLVGMLYPGRQAEELRGVVGPLARYLPIAARFNLQAPLREAALQVRQEVEEAETWGEYFSWDHATGSGHGASGFPVCFEGAVDDWELTVAGLRVAPSRLAWTAEVVDGFALALSCRGQGEDLQLTLRHDPRRFHPEAARHLAGRLSVLLRSIAERPEAPLADSPPMAEEELSRWLALSVAPPATDRGRQGKTLHEVFEDQADRTPDRLALVAGEDRLSFRDLDVRANRLAHHLRAAGAGPEVPVVLCLERSAEAIVALLAVWKAGAPYVPLDLTQPAERLAHLLEDTEAPLLVTHSQLASALPEAGRFPGLRRVCLDEDAAAIARRPASRPAGAAGPRNLAYVIYTSGSTGRPKGVQVEHRSALQLLAALEATVLDPLADAGQLPGPLLASLNAPMIFDASVQQLALLLAGHALCVVPQDIRADSAVLLAFLREQGVELLDCTPSQLRLLVDAGLLDGPAGPRIVLTAGEAVDEPLWRRLAQAGRAVCFNLYGPTECSVDATFHRIEPGSATPTIGRPLAGYEVFLLDGSQRPVPPGAPGELCLGGGGLARGYLHRPELTAERFVPHPFAQQPGQRLYRTGDLGRHLPNGDLSFLGRLDHQVKIRGFRIELGEIEAVLVEQAGVRDAVVVAREDRADSGPGDRRLVAYVVGDVAVDALRQVLRERLPDYMVPAAFVTLPALPLSPNGKVDRKALPAPERPENESYVQPRTPVEEILAGLWADLLGLERVGAGDHFFDLGGHSLLATQMISRLRGTFDVEMPLRSLFESPVLSDLAARVEEALRTARGQITPPLVPVPREGPLPLSFAQQRLWFIDQLESGTPLYNIPVALRVEGPLQVVVLELCLGEIVRRHEALRTVFAAPEGEPVQVIRPATPFVLPVVDLAGLPESRREAAALALTGEERGRPFDLARGPLLRGLLLRLAATDHIAALTLHHVVSDGWSMGILVREVTALYGAFTEGRPSPLPELPVQYADFSLWQRSWLRGEVLESEISFWRGQLAGLPPRLELPTDRPRPAVQSFRGTSRPLRLPAELTRQIHALSRREGATLFMVLLAGFQTLLARYSRQSDVAVGAPVAGRNRTEVEGLIGFFVNTLVLRGNLMGAPSFAELLGRVRETALAAHAHQEVPFEKLVQELSPERSLAHTPLFQVTLVLQNAPVERLGIQDLRLRPVGGAATTAKFDLTLTLEERDGRLAGAVEHATDLFDGATIERLIAHLEGLLASAVAAAEISALELPLLTGAERQQLLREWSDTEAGFAEGCLHQDVAAQAARTPSAVAVELGDERWTYRRLIGSARRLARHLRTLGVGPDAIVGLCAERSPAMVVGMLAVLEAGGAYLPLDPTYPAERLAFMLGDSGARVLLVQEHLRAQVPAGDRTAVALDGRWDAGEEMGEPLGVEVSPDNLAYVIYTSGSTGRPKGVMVPHRGVRNRLRWAQEAYRLDARDAVLQKASFGFDFSVWECFAPLSAGARLVLAEPGRQGDSRYLVRAIREHGITIVHFVPSMLAVFAQEEGLEGCVSLRQVFAGGEVLPPELRDRVLARLSVPLDNQYGPTEISIDTTRGVCAPGQDPHRVSIGRPIANSRLYVVDAELRPVPVGVAGELLVGGVSVTRGYLRRPDLTAERFIPDPFSGGSGRRLYRTGDLARLRPDGSFDFLGRLDHQVKVRGFRIETGEIEAVLTALPGVREAAVIMREDTPGDQRLVAYLSGDAAGDALRSSLRERLPDHMVPAAFVPLAALPLTPSGKVDRKALARLVPGSPAVRREDGAPAEPHGRMERAVAALWSEVLGVEKVGRDESFFDLGGHSLLLIRVQARLAEELGREVSLVDLFRYPTVRALADFLEPGHREAPVPAPRRASVSPEDRRIAIIGMAGRFPGASGVEAFWQNLCAGIESLSLHSEADLDAAGVDRTTRSSPAFVPAGGVIEGIELFDAGFFGYTPRDAETADPQHRLFLECSWEALEGAGYVPGGFPGPVGVFAGVTRSSYLWNLISHPEILQSVGTYRLGIATDKDFLTTTVSYKLDLKGPSLAIQTACSTSLVAVHVACRSLLAGECDMALAGGSSITVPQTWGYLYQEGGIRSPDGHCRSFDARAQGTVGSNGVGVVVLKRLADALADGDPIRAVILGTAINNDGADKVGYTAPGVDGQTEVIRAALEAGGVDPRTVGYVEAHGTATPLGDPIEVAALTRAFREAGTDESGFCALGSVKSNIGHLDAAAGVAGLIKAALAVERGLLPPSLHFESPNPALDLEASPFRVNDRLREWRPAQGVRRAGVSSFGIGGTNAHAVLEEPPPPEPGSPPRHAWQLLVLSARTPAALAAASTRLRQHLEENPATDLADAAWTLQVGRRAFEHRRAVLCKDTAGALAALAVSGGDRAEASRGVVFLFPGQGAQHPAMGLGLYRSEPVFRDEVDRAAEALRAGLGLDLLALLESGEEDTALAQPALFAVQHALARLWMSWGIRPEAMIGHSLGEYVAACLAGVFSFEDGLALVAERGRLMGALPPGAMANLPLAEEAVAPLLSGSLALAAVNGPEHCVVSGPDEEIRGLLDRLAARGIEGRRLRTSHAFHSALVEPAMAPFAAAARRIRLAPPQLPWISNVTGTWITEAEATDPGYWARHLRATVRFADGLSFLYRWAQDRPAPVLLEVGPGRTLSAPARRHPGRSAAHAVVPSLRHPDDTRDDAETVLAALGQLWSAGAPVDWRALHAGERRRRLPLPTYPFERQRYWIDRRTDRRQAKESEHRLPGSMPVQLEEWASLREGGAWLITGELGGIGLAIAEHLAASRARLALLGRTDLPPENQERLDRMRELGAEVIVEPVDVADVAALRAAVRHTVERFSGLNGVIHAVGAPEDGLLQSGTCGSIEEALAVEIRGTLALGEVCRELPLESLLLLSSAHALVGKTFLETWARRYAAETGIPTQAIAWDAQPGDRGFTARREPEHTPAGSSPEEPRPAAAGRHERPSLTTSYVPPSDDFEQEIAEIWQEVFGLERIGIHDNFFELGGDSLTALQLVSRLGKVLAIDLPVRSLLEAPTISALAGSIEEAMLASASQEELHLVRNKGELS